jgi:hypothetical protein
MIAELLLGLHYCRNTSFLQLPYLGVWQDRWSCSHHVNYLVTLCSILQCYISRCWLLHSPSYSHDHLTGFFFIYTWSSLFANAKLMQVIWSCRFSFDPNTKLGLDVASCLITRYLLQLQGFDFLDRRTTLYKFWMKSCLSCLLPFNFIYAMMLFIILISVSVLANSCAKQNIICVTQIRLMFSVVCSCSPKFF